MEEDDRAWHLRTLATEDPCYDPCIFCLMGEFGQQGHILIEVDDLATHGNAVHAENMAKLQKTSRFGCGRASTTVRVSECAGRSLIQDESYGFHVRQAKFVQERLSPTLIPRGRRSDKKSETTEGEKRQLRAAWGSVNLVQRETRPDVSALASLGMGSLNHSTVQDLCDANMAVERLESRTFLGVKLPHIPIHKVRWATVQDASWANAAEDHSQGAFLVGVGWWWKVGWVGSPPYFIYTPCAYTHLKTPERFLLTFGHFCVFLAMYLLVGFRSRATYPELSGLPRRCCKDPCHKRRGTASVKLHRCAWIPSRNQKSNPG